MHVGASACRKCTPAGCQLAADEPHAAAVTDRDTLHPRRYPNNFAMPGKLCAQDEEMRPFIKQNKGYTLVAEGHGGTMWTKLGYVAKEVGSTMLLQVGNEPAASQVSRHGS
jgi:hypothetical protein